MDTRHFTRCLTLLVCVATMLFRRVVADTQSICSTQNTADMDSLFWEWQSNGWCSDQCRNDGYAIAIVQWQLCWCSNDLPASETDLSDCGHYCPGFKQENCGDEDKGTFGYIVLGKPSGTAGAAKPDKTSGSSSKSTAVKTVTQEASVVTSVITPSSTKSSSTSDRDSSSMVKHTTQSVATISGDVVTHTAIITSYVDPKAGDKDEKSSTPTGAIAGGVVGGLSGLALIVGGVLFFFWRHRRQQHLSQYGGSDAGNSGVTRNTSVLSKTGLLGSAEKGYLGPVHTSSHRSNNNADPENVTPVSERRNSRPLFYDQRLNPSALMENDNHSRASIGTMQDNRDYTRQLNVRNPDPDPDHD